MFITHLRAKTYGGSKVYFKGANGLRFGGPMVLAANHPYSEVNANSCS